MIDEMAEVEGAVKAKKGPPAPPGATSPKVEAAVAGDVPPPAAPLPQEVVNSLVGAVNEAFTSLLPGEEMPPIAFRAEGPTTELPTDLKARVIALSQFPDVFPPAEAYRFDALDALTTPEGMGEAVNQIVQMAGDTKLIAQLSSGAPAKKPEPAAQPKKPSLEEKADQFV